MEGLLKMGNLGMELCHLFLQALKIGGQPLDLSIFGLEVRLESLELGALRLELDLKSTFDFKHQVQLGPEALILPQLLGCVRKLPLELGDLSRTFPQGFVSILKCQFPS